MDRKRHWRGLGSAYPDAEDFDVTKGTTMSLAIYLFLALIAGATWGTSLGILLNAPRTKASETKQWISVVASMLIVISCAVVMKNTGEAGNLSFMFKASAAVAFLASFGIAFLRQKVKL
jgi:hypothetical protein